MSRDPEREAFEQSLIENPEDPFAWAVYADWLCDQGDPRGELIQTQLRLESSPPFGDERRQLARVERNLMAENIRPWLGSLADQLIIEGPIEVHEGLVVPNYRINRGIEFEFRRGFLRSFRSDWTTILPLIPQLSQEMEARLLTDLEIGRGSTRLRMNSNDLQPLASARFCSSLRKLNLVAWPAREDFVGSRSYLLCINALRAFVANCERLTNVVVMLGSDFAAAIAACSLPHLQTLTLGDETAECLPIVGENPTLDNLEELDVRGRAGDFALRMFFATPHLPRLRRFSIEEADPVDDTTIDEIIDASVFSQLETVRLPIPNLTDAHAVHIAAAKPENLRRVDLRGTQITEIGMRSLEAADINVTW